MPSPRDPNERAAAFVEYYASPQMVAKSVDRLYYGGIERKKVAQARAEQSAYPPTRRSVRSQSEIDAYLQSRVHGELLKRQQRRTALQQALDPTVEPPPQYLREKEMKAHLHHMYDEQLRLRRSREAELQRIFGVSRSPADVQAEILHGYSRSPTTTIASTSPQRKQSAAQLADAEERAERFAKLERGWRPPPSSMKYDDNRRLLVSQYDYYADPNKYAELNLKSRPMTAEERKALQDRLELLSRPTRITPAVLLDEGNNKPPPFRVSGKIRYDD